MSSLMLTTPTTELEAVNTILSSIGESPINSLNEQPTHDVVLAINTLKEVSTEVQTEGWNWNTEDDYPLVPNLDNEIVLPTNTVRVHFRDSFNPLDVVLRGQRLYDRANHTYKFTETLYATITFLLPFEELPETARRYIVIRAARLFQDRAVGAVSLHDFLLQDEARARAALMAEERMQDRPNILSGTAQRLTGWRPLDVLRRW